MITIYIGKDSDPQNINNQTLSTIYGVDPFSTQYKFIFNDYDQFYKPVSHFEWHLYVMDTSSVVKMYTGTPSDIDNSITFFIDIREITDKMQLWSYDYDDSDHNCITRTIKVYYRTMVHV